MSLPTPRKLFRQFETGQISQSEFQAAMAEHAKGLIVEMEEAHRNPVAAFFDSVYSRATAFSLARKHGEHTVREVLNALADLDDFPPAALLWNALHTHVPLHCFFRIKSDPVFRILQMDVKSQMITVDIEYGPSAKGSLRTIEIKLRRVRNGQLIEESRR